MREVPAFNKRKEILKDLHLAGGHVGVMKLYHMVRHQYWWFKMLEDCIDLV